GEPLPEPEPGPERAVVEPLGHAVVVRGPVLHDQDVVLDRQPPAAPGAGQRGGGAVIPELLPACRAAPDIPALRPSRRREGSRAGRRHPHPPPIRSILSYDSKIKCLGPWARPGAGGTAAVREAVAQPAPDAVADRPGPDATDQGLEVDVEAQHHVDEFA